MRCSFCRKGAAHLGRHEDRRAGAARKRPLLHCLCAAEVDSLQPTARHRAACNRRQGVRMSLRRVAAQVSLVHPP